MALQEILHELKPLIEEIKRVDFDIEELSFELGLRLEEKSDLVEELAEKIVSSA